MAASYARKDRRCPVSPVQIEERHAWRVQQHKSLFELIIATMLANDVLSLNAKRVRVCHFLRGVNPFLPLPKKPMMSPFQ